MIGGFALIQVRSLDEAKQWAGRFADVVGDTEIEIREVSEFR